MSYRYFDDEKLPRLTAEGKRKADKMIKQPWHDAWDAFVKSHELHAAIDAGHDEKRSEMHKLLGVC